MSLIGLFTRQPATPPPVTFEVPAALPRLVNGPAPATLAATLNEGRVVDGVTQLAETLPEKDAIRWAADASEMTKAAKPAADSAATSAARAWLREPSASAQTTAATAAREAGHQGPGAWAAQAAAWAQPAENSAAAASSAPSPLVAGAVKGAVLLAAAMANPEFDLTKHLAAALAESTAAGGAPPASGALPREVVAQYKPILDRGLAIAAGAA